MIAQPCTRTVTLVLDPPQPCHDCGHPCPWFAAGVSGCDRRCGARTAADSVAAREALAAYLGDLPRLAGLRSQVAATLPARPDVSPRPPPPLSRILAAAGATR